MYLLVLDSGEQVASIGVTVSDLMTILVDLASMITSNLEIDIIFLLFRKGMIALQCGLLCILVILSYCF